MDIILTNLGLDIYGLLAGLLGEIMEGVIAISRIAILAISILNL